MKIYVASSWRNQYHQEVVAKLRSLGHEVYDFRGPGDGWGANGDGPGGFSWNEIDYSWKDWTIDSYIKALDHPLAIEGFNRDMGALQKCDACIMVNPCGQSAHAEMGWATGAGKLVAVYCPEIREPDLMVKMAGIVTNKWDCIELWLRITQTLLIKDIKHANS